MKIEIWTDGGAIPNPGSGGYAAVFVVDGVVKKRLSGGAKNVTNNVMEITAVLRAVEEFKRPSEFTVYSDSQYVIKSMTEWIPKRGYQRYANADLFAALLKACEPHTIRWQWVRGHNGSEFNELADHLSSERILDGAVCGACGEPFELNPEALDWKARTITCGSCGEVTSMIEAVS